MGKRLLIDLTDYGHLTCGFGQIAQNYAEFFAKKKQTGAIDFDLIYLLPPKYKDQLHWEGVKCVYIRKTLNKLFPFTLPKADIWFAVNQQRKYFRQSGNTKLVLTIHDMNFLTEKVPWKAKRYVARLQHWVNKSSVVCAISEYTANIVRKNINLKGKEVKVIANGIEPLGNSPVERPAFVRDSTRPFFFVIGQYRPKKNQHLLIQMMDYLPDYDLYVCGERTNKPYAAELDELAATRSNVTITGPISAGDRLWLFHHATAYLFPSIGEGFGLPLLEAMEAGIAVFSSTATCLPEIGGGHAFLWPELEPQKMAQVVQDSLITFANEPQRVVAEQQHAATFSYERHINAYIELFESL